MSSKQHWHDVACRRGDELRAMRAELEAAKALNSELVEALGKVSNRATRATDTDSCGRPMVRLTEALINECRALLDRVGKGAA